MFLTFYAIFLRLIGDICSSIVLGVPLMYYSKKLSRLGANGFIRSIREDYHRVNAKAPSGASLSSPRPKSHIYISRILLSNRSTSRSGVLRAPISSLPPRFQDGLKQTVATIAVGIVVHTPVYHNCGLSLPITRTTGTTDSDIIQLSRLVPKHGVSGESRTRRPGAYQ